MGRISVEFFALRDEIYNLVWDWLTEHNLKCVAVVVTPDYVAKVINSNLIDCEKLRNTIVPDRICLGLEKPQMDAATAYEFMLRNPDWLVIDIGKEDSEGIKPSSISAVTEDVKHLTVWRDVKRNLEKRTSSGLWCLNPQTLKRDFYKSLRYTTEVAKLSSEGKILRSLAGWNVFQIKPPNERG